MWAPAPLQHPKSQGTPPAQRCQDWTSPGTVASVRLTSQCHPVDGSHSAVPFLSPKWVLGGPRSIFAAPCCRRGATEGNDGPGDTAPALCIDMQLGKQLTPKMSEKEQNGDKGDSGESHKLCRIHSQRKSRTEREVGAEGDGRGTEGPGDRWGRGWLGSPCGSRCPPPSATTQHCPHVPMAGSCQARGSASST